MFNVTVSRRQSDGTMVVIGRGIYQARMAAAIAENACRRGWAVTVEPMA
jgi:orotidine-5'-phosphate decarboxylase